MLEGESSHRVARDQTRVGWSVVDIDDGVQGVLEEVDDGVVCSFLGVFGCVDELALNVVVDSGQSLFSDL